ncbi:neuronal acetylcholine receptor subunit alpha-5 [Drosophila grimshawi]|uniref:GH11231 n=1 Tax=Drosophila grimshawi TaxID=7222 RepID=B4JDQ8_DROGR|nr:neuronal acetylcholine receptor subunit alpha-5 [Drosophila grimshawi]EDW03428.1 GH11231 [Drosophila grimshawi]
MSYAIKALISGRGLPFLLVGLLLISVPSTISKPDEADGNDRKVANVSTLDRLHLNLFMNYDTNAQPTVQGKPTNINLGLSVNYLDIDELNSKITLHCWLSASWMDELRSWNPLDYDNITKVHVPASQLWKPEITLFNAAADDNNYLAETQVIISHDGKLLWVPTAVYTAYCNLNMLNWPYDVQTCKLKIGTWSQSHIEAAYDKRRPALDYDEMVQSTEWDIVSGKTKFVRQDHYNYVEFTFKAERRSSMYTAVIYTPASCIVILALSTFWLPPQMGEKILLNGILIVLIAAFLMYFAQLLPVLAGNTPLVVIFYSSSLLILSISTIIEVVVLYLATAQHKRRLPDCLKRLLHGKLGTWLLLSHFTSEAETQSRQGNGIVKELDDQLYDGPDDLTNPLDINPSEEPSARALQFDWMLLATAVDRICFITFSVVFIVLSIVYAI